MHEHFESRDIAAESRWHAFTDALIGSLGPSEGRSRQLGNSLALFRRLGAKHVVIENCYIDRDFSACISSFYSTLFQPHTKLCRRLHFFAKALGDHLVHMPVAKRAEHVATHSDEYLGNIVLRPIPWAPVSSTIASARHAEATFDASITVVGPNFVHLMGTTLRVDGVAVTEQDSRVGACAQSTLWGVGRHTHHKHRGAWYSVPKITELALAHADRSLAWDLPAGSASLSLDAMIRALRSMDRHPLLIVRDDNHQWPASPRDIIWQHLDSDIPVIVGLEREEDPIGHAVVAVGVENGAAPRPAPRKQRTTLGRGARAFIVNDDQEGAYAKMPTRRARGRGESNYPDTLENCSFLLIPMPEKVFYTGFHADDRARLILKKHVLGRSQMLANEWGAKASQTKLEVAFEKSVAQDTVVSRTYLTHGWNYQARAIVGDMHEDVRTEIGNSHFPRFVWVSEFYLPGTEQQWPPPDKSVMAQVVIDATGNLELVVDIPGLAILYRLDQSNPAGAEDSTWIRTDRQSGFNPKRGGAVREPPPKPRKPRRSTKKRPPRAAT